MSDDTDILIFASTSILSSSIAIKLKAFFCLYKIINLQYLLSWILSKIKSCIKLTGFVNSIDNFNDQPKVINGASDLMASIFGEAGMHTRAAVSTNSLPLGVAVEIDGIFEINLN